MSFESLSKEEIINLSIMKLKSLIYDIENGTRDRALEAMDAAEEIIEIFESVLKRKLKNGI